MGFFFESVSDYQLLRFMQNPLNQGKLMKYGLWKYSRHPNYFGEVCMWWGFFLITASVVWGLSGIISPLTITILLLFFTGVPWVEKVLEKHPEFAEYKRKTSIFIPWFVRQ
jgi:steroid 5-alpha reductase family enzyme